VVVIGSEGYILNLTYPGCTIIELLLGLLYKAGYLSKFYLHQFFRCQLVEGTSLILMKI